MSAWTSPRADAIRTLRKHYGLDATSAPLVVDRVFVRLADPDRDMLAAGAIELERALPPDATKGGTGRAYVRNLAAAIWGAMLERAR